MQLAQRGHPIPQVGQDQAGHRDVEGVVGEKVERLRQVGYDERDRWERSLLGQLDLAALASKPVTRAPVSSASCDTLAAYPGATGRYY